MCQRLRVLGIGFKVLGLGFRVLGVGFRVLGLGFRPPQVRSIDPKYPQIEAT